MRSFLVLLMTLWLTLSLTTDVDADDYEINGPDAVRFLEQLEEARELRDAGDAEEALARYREASTTLNIALATAQFGSMGRMRVGFSDLQMPIPKGFDYIELVEGEAFEVARESAMVEQAIFWAKRIGSQMTDGRWTTAVDRVDQLALDARQRGLHDAADRYTTWALLEEARELEQQRGWATARQQRGRELLTLHGIFMLLALAAWFGWSWRTRRPRFLLTRPPASRRLLDVQPLSTGLAVEISVTVAIALFVTALAFFSEGAGDLRSGAGWWFVGGWLVTAIALALFRWGLTKQTPVYPDTRDLTRPEAGDGLSIAAAVHWLESNERDVLADLGIRPLWPTPQPSVVAERLEELPDERLRAVVAVFCAGRLQDTTLRDALLPYLHDLPRRPSWVLEPVIHALRPSRKASEFQQFIDTFREPDRLVVCPRSELDSDDEVTAESLAEWLEHAMVRGRRWSVEEWQETFDNPWCAAATLGLVWGAFDERDRLVDAFRFDGEGGIFDVDAEPFTPRPWTRIGVAHSAELGPDRWRSWSSHLGDFEVFAPFAQLDRDPLPPRTGDSVRIDATWRHERLTMGTDRPGRSVGVSRTTVDFPVEKFDLVELRGRPVEGCWLARFTVLLQPGTAPKCERLSFVTSSRSFETVSIGQIPAAYVSELMWFARNEDAKLRLLGDAVSGDNSLPGVV